jgi:succinoglycan biosynthesis transport protein ExoP
MRASASYELVAQNPGKGAGSRDDALAFREHNYTWEQVLRVLRKHIRFALLVACGLMGLIGLYTFIQKDFYKPTARLEIAPPDRGINTLHEIESSVEVEDPDYLETQVQILSSDALAVCVIRELHLDKHPEFVSQRQLEESAGPPGRGDTPTVAPGELAILQDQLDLANLTPAESIALEQFRRSLSVGSVRNARLVEINFSSHSPQLAQLVTNTLVTKFIDQNYKHRYTTTMQASEWLSSQLNDLRSRVEESGQAVADYQKRNGLVEVDDRDVPMSQLMSEVSHQLSEAQANRIEDEAYVRMIDEGHGDAVPALRDDKLYQDLMGHYTDLRTQLAQAKVVYGDANLNVKKLQDELAEVSVQIDAERQRAMARSRSAFAAARDREQLMILERNKLRASMAHISSQLAAYHMLKTEANANSELYETLQGRLREAGIYAGLRSSNIRVVDLASNLRKPTGPHRLLVFMLGAFGSCLFAVVLSFVRESFHNTVRTPDDVKSWIGLPSLALLPAMRVTDERRASQSATLNWISHRWHMRKEKGERMEVEIMKSPTAESEAMRDLRTALLHAKAGNTPRVILISSSMEGEGKTTVAVNFAIALAQLGKTCLLEGDLRQPRIAQVFAIEAQGGLADFLNGTLALRDALIDVPAVEGLTLLPAGRLPENPADVLSSPQMGALLDTLKQTYSFIVVDSPPIIRFSDARFLSCLADEVVLVGRYGITTRRAMQRTAELLSEVNASVAGVVLNGIDLFSPDYDYYTYGYTKWAKRVGDSVLNGSRPQRKNDGEKPGAMSAHA